jgi:L-malate glycosyltransferase
LAPPTGTGALPPEQGTLRVLLAHDRLGYEQAGLHGGGRLLLEWTRALEERGVRVVPVVLRSSPNLRALVKREGFPVRFLERANADPRTLIDLVRIVRRERIDLLHLQGHGARLFGRLAAGVTRRPAIVHVHADYRRMPKGYPWYVRAADRALAPLAERVFLVAEALRPFATGDMGLGKRPIDVWHNPVDRRRFHRPSPDQRAASRAALGLRPDTPVAITVGRLDRLKGVDLQVAAWPEVHRAVPGAILLVVGEGPERAALEREAAPLGDAVRFLGFRDDIERLLWAADVAVLSSRQEALSLAAVEAMAAGVPVVATDVGGSPEVVRDGVTGLIVPPEDPASLARALISLLGNPPLRARLAERADHAATELDLPAFAARLEAAYRAVLADRIRRGPPRSLS